jgi:hypothetical protein
MTTHTLAINDRGGCRRAGTSLAEVAVSTLIVGILLTASLSTALRVTQSRMAASDAAYASQLAHDLAAEIISRLYTDPTSGGTALGPETGEALGSRAGFDDVDDYDNWQESPPQDRNGNLLTTSTAWRRRVKVEYVDSTLLSQTLLGVDDGIKRITVTVEKQGVERSVVSMLRTRNYKTP